MVLYNIKTLTPAKNYFKRENCQYFQVMPQDFIMKAQSGLKLKSSEYWAITALNKLKLIHQKYKGSSKSYLHSKNNFWLIMLIKILKTTKFVIPLTTAFKSKPKCYIKIAYLEFKTTKYCIYAYMQHIKYCVYVQIQMSKRLTLIIVLIFQQVLANYIIPKLPILPIRAVTDWCIQCNAPNTDCAFKTKYCFTQIQVALVNNALLISRGINASSKLKYHRQKWSV